MSNCSWLLNNAEIKFFFSLNLLMKLIGRMEFYQWGVATFLSLVGFLDAYLISDLWPY